MAFSENNFNISQYSFNTWHLIAPVGTTLEKVLDKSSYSHIAHRLTKHDRIVIDLIDDTASFKVKVMDVPSEARAKTWAKVELEHHKVFDKSLPKEHVGLDVEYNPANKKHRVLKDNKKTLVDEFNTREEADIFAESFLS